MRWHRNERGALSNRGIGFGLAGLALVACGMGLPGHGGGGTTSPTTTIGTTTTVSTTTLPGATTTTAVTVPPTTTTTVSPTTTTTVSGSDPCASENASTQALGRWPCLVNTGPHITFTAGVNIAANNGTSCTLCPPGVTWSGGEYRIGSCVSVDGWKFVDDMYVTATNGDKALHRTEAATKAAACVKLTHVLIAPPEPGADSEVALETGFAGGCCGHQCTFNNVQTPCGSVYLADSEISMAQPRTGFNYATSNTNLHLWRDYIHGGPQGIDCDGFCEVHDSYLRADRSEAAMNGKAHGDAYFQDSGGGEWMFVDHNKLFCGAQEIDCNRDGAYVNDVDDTGGTVSNNLYMASDGVQFCASTGVDQSRAKPNHPFGVNITFKNNVFEIGSPHGGDNGHPGPCQNTSVMAPFGVGTNAVDDFTKSVALSHNDHWCNNRMSDGSLVDPSFETGGCP